MADEQRDLLKSYVTNLDDQVFAIQNLQGIVGAVMARYSRAETGLRETLLREFVKEDKLNAKKASSLIDRVLIAYGDDSVGELEGSHLSFESISMLATKEIEHRRIGGSPIEQSTRYVRYDFRGLDGTFPYHVPVELEGHHKSHYVAQMDALFEAYGSMWGPLVAHLERLKPLHEAIYDIRGHGEEPLSKLDDDRDIKNFQKTYRMDIKTKACDVLRAFLPLATRANVGLFGNGRFFQHLISKMLSSNLTEARALGAAAFEELSKVIPHYVKRARRLDYLIDCREKVASIAAQLNLKQGKSFEYCLLVEPDYQFAFQQGIQSPETLRHAINREMDLSMTASMIYPYVRCGFDRLRNALAEKGGDFIAKIWQAYYGERAARRDRPERGIEYGYPHNIEMVTEWAVYKDLMRHRMGTIQYQDLIPDLGFQWPEEIEDAGLKEEAEKAVSIAESLFADLDAHVPRCRSYAYLQGHRLRWMVSMNDRALMHMLELRTTVQGHPNYRKASQAMHRALASRFPERAERMLFVNHDPSYWSRGASEARQRVKESQLDAHGG
ncbi:MAG: FAD-dependent thymidylate synthase [Acidobacteria bacterium]|nr:FAD-dependent thymidylate synthase [Acidobacteriota bacterium]